MLKKLTRNGEFNLSEKMLANWKGNKIFLAVTEDKKLILSDKCYKEEKVKRFGTIVVNEYILLKDEILKEMNYQEDKHKKILWIQKKENGLLICRFVKYK